MGKSYSIKPPNDDCSNATQIIISNGGFGFGIFKGQTVDITDATVQTGEVFHNNLINSGNNQKSVWYKFYLPTARGVKVTLVQPSGKIPQTGAGFTTFYSNDCPPHLSSIDSAKLTPLGVIKDSYNPCLYAGNYYVQVGAQSSSDDSVYVQIEITAPNPYNSYDFYSAPLDFGTISSDPSPTYTFDAGCQTIDSSAEVCSSVLGPDFSDYTQTVWITFNTGSNVDFMKFNFGASNFSNSYKSNQKFGYKIYKGNVKTSGIQGINLFRDCNKLTQNSDLLPYIEFTCGELEANTDYTIQIFLHKLFTGKINTYFNKMGKVTNAPNPQNIQQSNILGVLQHSNSGVVNTLNDAFGCNSFMKDNLCGSVVPANYINKYVYDMNTWFTFSLADYSKLDLNFINGKLPFYARIYNGDVTGNCNLSLLTDFISNYSGNCFTPGQYSIQIMGISKADTNKSYYDNSNSMLDRDITLNIKVTDVGVINNYSLSDSNAVYYINSKVPLVPGTNYKITGDKFGCMNTVVPEQNDCDTGLTKAIYRVFNIDTSGILSITADNSLIYRLYSGNAVSLAVSQNAFTETSTIKGLTPATDCFKGGSQKLCISSGTFTLIGFGKNSSAGYNEVSPLVRFDTTTSLYFDPKHPDDMGDITTLLTDTSYSNKDHFSCMVNPLTIDGNMPCFSEAEQLYRQFYLNTSMTFSIRGTSPFRIFSGRVSDGILGLLTVKDSCTTIWNQDFCQTLGPGWFTLVSYGNIINNGDMYKTDEYTFLPVINPKFNKPYKADTATVDWGPNTGTNEYPLTTRFYKLDKDRYNCIPDTPISGVCDNQYTRVDYYTFKVLRNSFVTISDVPTQMLMKVYKFDVRLDSNLLFTAQPIQPCIKEKPYKISFCNLDSGSYTLAIYAIPLSVKTIQPIITVDRIEDSRFDNASSAYDFGLIPGDAAFHYGKPGDINPLDSLRNPSDDFITCSTGAQPTDPYDNICYTGIFKTPGSPSVDYPMIPNTALYNNDTASSWLPRRNLWYTFTCAGMGKITVNVNNMTPGDDNILPFSIYSSNYNGTLSYKQLLDSNLVDSTSKTLILFETNQDNCNGSPDNSLSNNNLSFYINQCDNSMPVRYFVLIDDNREITFPKQIDVGIKFEAVTSTAKDNDYFSGANIINGLNQTNTPYTIVQLDSGVYTGNVSNFSCATKSPSDINTCGTKTLWYGFDIDQQCLMTLNYGFYPDYKYKYDSTEVIFFKEIVPGDSTINGMQRISLNYVKYNGVLSGQVFLKPGRYYFMFTGCNQTTQLVKPQIRIERDPGDYCTDAIKINLNGIGQSTGTMTVNSHTIGEGFGESGSDMDCLFGPQGYKSSWFQVHLNTSIKIDATFILDKNNTNSLPGAIRYRVLYGECNVLTQALCISDALTQNTLPCMLSGDYYIQVVTPQNTMGQLNFTLKTAKTKDTLCIPIDPSKPHAEFSYSGACTGDTTKFFSFSSRGPVIKYLWNFGYKDSTSDEYNPVFKYPELNKDSLYKVKLVVLDTISGKADSMISFVNITPYPDISINKKSNAICRGDCDSLFAITNTQDSLKYIWSTGETNKNINVCPAISSAYNLTIYNANGCANTTSTIVTVNSLPVANAGTD
ncbi:MAG: hypothetical protein Q8880_11015, partial [Bacteroidota bacterium]|nr:hypothetical protein [Bacteroidota bacterium]